MRLEHQFTVNAPVDVVWQALLDPERVAPCMPGATLTSVDGNTFAGTVKVKMGPISLQYKGTGEFVSSDEAARKVEIKAAGKDARGNGTASADVTVTLSEKDGATTGTVVTELSITGKPAQFGRGMIAEVGGRILDKFAGNLAAQLEPAKEPAPEAKPAEETPAAAKPSTTRPTRAKTAPAATGSADAKPSTAAAKPRRTRTTKPAAAAAEQSPEKAAEAASAATESATTKATAAAAAEEQSTPSAEPAPVTEPAPVAEPASAASGSGPVKAPALAQSSDDAIDLLEFAGSSVAKRAAPVIVLGLVLAIWLTRRRRR